MKPPRICRRWLNRILKKRERYSYCSDCGRRKWLCYMTKALRCFRYIKSLVFGSKPLVSAASVRRRFNFKRSRAVVLHLRRLSRRRFGLTKVLGFRFGLLFMLSVIRKKLLDWRCSNKKKIK